MRKLMRVILSGILFLPAAAQAIETPTGRAGAGIPADVGRLSDPLGAPSAVSRSTEDFLPGGAPPMAGPVDPATYTVGPGDVLQLQLWGRVTRNWLLPVGPEGYVLPPGSGGLQVGGRRLEEVRRTILDGLRGTFRGVESDLRLARPRTFQVYLTGQVRAPGPTLAAGTNRVHDILTPAVLLENASRRRIEVLRADGTREFADLDLFLRTGSSAHNPWLRDGDVLNVPVATDFVWANGAVARPGQIELGLNDSLLTLFRLAGNPIPAADVEKALLVRWIDAVRAESLWIRLDDVYARRTNMELREGDRLYVYYLTQYHLQHETTILGEVARPGVYPITEGRHRLSDLVAAAGGFLSTADLSSIRVHRRSLMSGERDQEMERLLRLSREQLTASEYEVLRTKLAGLREDYRVDWDRLAQAKESHDLLMRDGDVVRVERLVSSIRVDGEVRRPGILSFRPGLGISDYVRQAGGYTDRAWPSRVRVTRAVTGQALLARSVRALDPGDFVWVPERPDKTGLDHAREILTALAQLATVVIAIRSVN